MDALAGSVKAPARGLLPGVAQAVGNGIILAVGRRRRLANALIAEAKLIERTVTTLEERLVGIKLKKGVHLEMQTGQGVNLNAARKFFFSPVIKKVKQRRTIKLSQKGNTKIRIMVSVNHHRVWIVGTIESSELIGPSPFVIHELLSDELNIAFGAQRSSSPSLQWRVQPIGEVQGQTCEDFSHKLLAFAHICSQWLAKHVFGLRFDRPRRVPFHIELNRECERGPPRQPPHFHVCRDRL